MAGLRRNLAAAYNVRLSSRFRPLARLFPAFSAGFFRHLSNGPTRRSASEPVSLSLSPTTLLRAHVGQMLRRPVMRDAGRAVAVNLLTAGRAYVGDFVAVGVRRSL